MHVCDLQIDYVYMGCTIMETRTSNIAREASLGAGLPITIPSSTGRWAFEFWILKMRD